MKKNNLELLQICLLIVFVFSLIIIIHEICVGFGVQIWFYVFLCCGVGYMLIEENK